MAWKLVPGPFPFLKGICGQNFTPVFYIFVDFIEKEPSTKICGVLIIFHEVIQSFEFDVSDVISVNLHNFTPTFLHIFVNFMDRELLKKYWMFLIIIYKDIKLLSFEWQDGAWM